MAGDVDLDGHGLEERLHRVGSVGADLGADVVGEGFEVRAGRYGRGRRGSRPWCRRSPSNRFRLTGENGRAGEPHHKAPAADPCKE